MTVDLKAIEDQVNYELEGYNGPDSAALATAVLPALAELRELRGRLARRDVEFAAVLVTKDFSLHGVRAEFLDTTQLLDVTTMGAAERELLQGIQSWRITIESSGRQDMNPAELLYWLENNSGRVMDLHVS